MSLTFHQSVMTPQGPGVVQGRLVKPGEPDRVLISHKPAEYRGELDKCPRVWVLRDYAVEDVKAK